MSPFEIRLEILKLAFEILRAQETKPELMPHIEAVLLEAEKLNQFVSNRMD